MAKLPEDKSLMDAMREKFWIKYNSRNYNFTTLAEKVPFGKSTVGRILSNTNKYSLEGRSQQELARAGQLAKALGFDGEEVDARIKKLIDAKEKKKKQKKKEDILPITIPKIDVPDGYPLATSIFKRKKVAGSAVVELDVQTSLYKKATRFLTPDKSETKSGYTNLSVDDALADALAEKNIEAQLLKSVVVVVKSTEQLLSKLEKSTNTTAKSVKASPVQEGHYYACYETIVVLRALLGDVSDYAKSDRMALQKKQVFNYCVAIWAVSKTKIVSDFAIASGKRESEFAAVVKECEKNVGKALAVVELAAKRRR